MSEPRTIAVTGINATDNPGPGVSVIRALRHTLGDDAFFAGLRAYVAAHRDAGVRTSDLQTAMRRMKEIQDGD